MNNTIAFPIHAIVLIMTVRLILLLLLRIKKLKFYLDSEKYLEGELLRLGVEHAGLQVLLIVKKKKAQPN